MNKSRRAEITSIRNRLALLLTRLEELRDDEQAAFDSMPEGCKHQQRQKAERATENLDDACKAGLTMIDRLDQASK